MSRAFVKDDAPSGEILIPARAPLPPGVENYVTPRGIELLRAERAELEAERLRVQSEQTDEAERTRQLTVLNGQLAELQRRIGSAKIVEPTAQAEVRFGATVTVRMRSGRRPPETRRLTLVGVDEADLAADRIAFTAPIAKAMLGLKVGEQAALKLPRGEQTLEIVAVAYDLG